MNRRSIISGLADRSSLPLREISYCLDNGNQAEGIFLMLLERAVHKPASLSEEEGRALYYGIHLLGALGTKAAATPLLKLLTSVERQAALIVGDAIGSTIPRVLMALTQKSDPDYWPLVTNPSLDWLVRDAFLKAWTFQVMEGAINPKEAEAKLAAFPRHTLLLADDMIWLSWMTAIADLGLSGLAPLVRKMVAEGEIEVSPLAVSKEELEEFEADLRSASINSELPSWREQRGYTPFAGSVSDFEQASRSCPEFVVSEAPPRLLAAEREKPFES